MERIFRQAVTLAMAASLMVLLALPAAGDGPGMSRWVLYELERISAGSRDAWDDGWTGPIEAATVLAWFAHHGYPALLPDLDGDGVIDELDTIELADRLGCSTMATDLESGTSDARVVVGLAAYVAERYPGAFEMKIYDAGFVLEFAEAFGTPFHEAVVPGIRLVARSDPTYAAYQYELMSGEGVIIGLTLESSGTPNRYFAGRSFDWGRGSGETPLLDLASADEDLSLPGVQGQVIEVEAFAGSPFTVEYEGTTERVEFMVALSPVEVVGGLVDGACAEGAVAHDQETTATPYGELVVDECVNREDDVDTYTYTVSNLSIAHEGRGVCRFEVPNLGGLPTLAIVAPDGWLVSPAGPAAWAWVALCGSPGILAGSSVTFSVSVPGPTLDVLLEATASVCRVAGGLPVRTTGPGGSGDAASGAIPAGGCPEDAVGDHVDLLRTLHGDVRIEECVTRGDDGDTYTYTVTNLGFAHEGSGIVFFGVALSTHTPPVLDSSAPPGWDFWFGVAGWGWEVRDATRGLAIGDSATFSVTFDGPTLDGRAVAAINSLPEGAALPVLFRGETSGPVRLEAAPVEEPPVGDLPPCPPGSAASDRFVTSTPDGDVLVQECVSRDGDLDTYRYTLLNISYVRGGRGICSFHVPAFGEFTTVSMTAGPGWGFEPPSDVWRLWSWADTSGGDGLMPGESIDVSFTVEGPTTDQRVAAAIRDCTMMDGTLVETTGPGPVFRFPPMDPGDRVGGAACPADAIAHDVQVSSRPGVGDIQVEECVTREGDNDVYTYTLTNLSVGCDDAGIVAFSLPNPLRLPQEGVVSPSGWSFFEGPGRATWNWVGPEDRGIGVGESARFAVAVRGPTTDGPASGWVGSACDPGASERWVATTGPVALREEGCPDLVIETAAVTCACGWTPQQSYGCQASADLVVRNVGDADADAFFVELDTDEGRYRRRVSGLAVGELRTVSLEVSFEDDACPLAYTITVDSADEIDECDETNNTATGEVCCE